MLAVAAEILKGKGGNAQLKVIQYLRQGRGLHGSDALVIAGSAVPQQQDHLTVLLRCGQSADGKLTFCGDTHEVRQIGHRQGL